MALALFSFPAGAQMPGAPVLQNAWAAPGLVIAADIAGGSGSSVYAGALGWAPASGRFQLSGGGGFQSVSGGGSRGVYGVRAAFPLMQMMGGKLGIAGFAGVGGGAGKTGDTTRTTTMIPAGVAMAFRQAIGSAGRGFSFYLDPVYQYHTGGSGSQGYFRVAAGVDAGISSRFGLTLGAESGGKAGTGEAGPGGTSFGVGISMKLR
jgi:hypothetical protein